MKVMELFKAYPGHPAWINLILVSVIILAIYWLG